MLTSKNNPDLTAQDLIEAMTLLHDEAGARHLTRFFKTAPGQYGEGDRFLGIRVPQTRQMAKMAHTLPLSEIHILLESPWHEIRLCGLMILAHKFQQLSKPKQQQDEACIRQRDALTDFYLRHARQANNWDLVDLSVTKILGLWLTLPSASSPQQKLERMDRLAHSDNLWEQRMAVVATYTPIHQQDFSYILRYAEMLLSHPHDLMQKAIGWMLRELGKQDKEVLLHFLEQHHAGMARTTLRYAIERFPEAERKYWLLLDKPAR